MDATISVKNAPSAAIAVKTEFRRDVAFAEKGGRQAARFAAQAGYSLSVLALRARQRVGQMMLGASPWTFQTERLLAEPAVAFEEV